MLECFARLTPSWLKRATVYTGSVGPFANDFRFRLQQDKENNQIHAAVYSKVCYELAQDIQAQDFDWTEDGIEQMKVWLQQQYESFAAQLGLEVQS